MLFGFFASIRGIFLMHLFKFSVMFGLFRLQIKLHMLQILQIFIFDFFSESLFFRSDLFCLSSVFFFDGFNHIIQFFKVVVVSLFHLTSFSQKFILEYPNISPELFHKSLHA